MNNPQKANLNLIWIKNQGFWVYGCPSCQKIKVERKEASC